jgi:glycosyltransferase involved in cell wall biosynthesis
LKAVPVGATRDAGPGTADGAVPPRPRILVCAYACHPARGSEEAVGWNWVQAMASFCEVTVITAIFHRAAIEAFLRTTEAPWARHVEFIYPPSRPWHYRPTPAWCWIEGSLLKPLMNWAYRGWLRAAARIASRLVAGQHYDLTHQLTYVGFRFPGGLWRLTPPFVWGPIGGLEDTPWRLFGALSPVGMLYFGGRNLINGLHRRLLRAPRHAAVRAGPGLIAATSGIARALQRCYGSPSTIISEVTTPPPRVGALTRRVAGEPLQIAWSGEHTPGKALPLLLRALARLPEVVVWRLTIFGCGSCTNRWRRLSRRLGLEGCCRWRGQVSREEMLAALDESHLFVITSLKDLTSTVLVEALSRGVPVLCPDHCGFADALTPTSGIRLPITSPATFIAALRDALLLLHDDEARRRCLSVGARRRARAFRVEAKALALQAIYARVLAPTGVRIDETGRR